MALKLDAAKWRKKRGMKRLLEALGAGEGLTRYVGGSIRDDLLNLPVSDIDIGPESSFPWNFVPIGNQLFFMANNGTTGQELFVTDGIAAVMNRFNRKEDGD